MSIIPQIALAMGVLTSSWGVRVRRFCGFAAGGGCHTGSRWRCYVVCVADPHTGCRWRCRGVCVGVRGSQIQDRAVAQGVVRGVIFWCVYGCGFAEVREGCRHTGCHWSCHLMRVVVRVCRCKRGLPQRVSLEVSSDACRGGDSQY